MGKYSLEAENKELLDCFGFCQEHEITIFICTYIASHIEFFNDKDPYWELVKILKKFPTVKCILLHGGITRILEYAELVRFNSNLLLDLSYTIIKYKNSSVDIDIKYLFNTLDQRLCIGTDHPEFHIDELRDRLKDFENGIPSSKLENIYFKNIKKFLEIE